MATNIEMNLKASTSQENISLLASRNFVASSFSDSNSSSSFKSMNSNVSIGNSSSTAVDLTGSKGISAADLRLRGATGNSYKDESGETTSSLMKINKKSWVRLFLKELTSVLAEKKAMRVMKVGIFNFISIIILLVWCRSTNSMALTAYTYLAIFDLMSLVTCLLTIWVWQQKPTPLFSFGYERFEVLSVFGATVLAQLGALFIIKESAERLLQQPEIYTGRLLFGTSIGFICHLLVSYGVKNKAFGHVIAAATSSWLQEHVADISQSVCHVVPGLSSFLLPRINPFTLIAFAGAVSLILANVLIDVNNFHIADTVAAICIAVMIIGTMVPMSVYSGKILLQTTPSHIIGQLDKCLREASTLDGVLEFRSEHFWTLSFGTLAGSLHVRIRRDANEQLVLAHVMDRLSNLVTVLTIQVFKDDWTRASTFQLLGNAALSNKMLMSPSFPPPRPTQSTIYSPSSSYSSNATSKKAESRSLLSHEADVSNSVNTSLQKNFTFSNASISTTNAYPSFSYSPPNPLRSTTNNDFISTLQNKTS